MSTKVRSKHAPIVRYGLCRNIRSKGMIVNIGETPENDSSQRQLLAVDKNTMPWDGTNWWCIQTGKVMGPDDKPCDGERCKAGRGCFEAEDAEPPVA